MMFAVSLSLQDALHLDLLSLKDTDLPFDPNAAAGPEMEVEFKKRPFGILRYQPGNGGKGAKA